MREIQPSPELGELLSEFDQRGGVLEFAFYDFDDGQVSYDSHRQAAVAFLDECEAVYRAFLESLDLREYPQLQNFRYKKDLALLTGAAIDYETFWGDDDVDPKRLDDNATFIPSVTGYKSAFFHPPHDLSGGVQGNLDLFCKISWEVLFGGQPTDRLQIWSWSTDCSNYFDAGREWCGTFFWTISQRGSSRIHVIAAAATD